MNAKYKRILGEHIQKHREAAGLTQQELGDEIGISNTSISKIERGITVPTLDNLIHILNALDVSADAVLYDIVKSSYPVNATQLEEKIKNLPANERNQILRVVETMSGRERTVDHV